MHFFQELFAGYHMDAVYLAGSLLPDLWHEQDVKRVLVSKSLDGWDALCKECSCQGAQLGQIKRTLRPLDLSKEQITFVKGLRDHIPFRAFTMPESAGRLPVAGVSERRMLHCTQGDPLTAEFLPRSGHEPRPGFLPNLLSCSPRSVCEKPPIRRNHPKP